MIALAAALGLLFRPVPTRLVSKKEEKSKSETTAPIANFDEQTSFFNSRNSLRQSVLLTTESKTKPVAGFTGSTVSLGNFNQTLNVKTSENEFVDQPWYERTGQIFLKICKDMADVKLLGQNVKFLFITLCNFFSFNALFITYIYIKIHCQKNNIPEPSHILSIIGITNIPMRLFLGWLADTKVLSAVNLNTICIAVAAISMFIVSHLTTFWSMVGFAIAFASGTGKKFFK